MVGQRRLFKSLVGWHDVRAIAGMDFPLRVCTGLGDQTTCMLFSCGKGPGFRVAPPRPPHDCGVPPQSQWWPGPNARRPQNPNRSRLKQHNCLGFCPSCALDTNADPAPNSSSHFAHCHSEFTIEFGTLPSCRCHVFPLQNTRCCKRPRPGPKVARSRRGNDGIVRGASPKFACRDGQGRPTATSTSKHIL